MRLLRKFGFVKISHFTVQIVYTNVDQVSGNDSRNEEEKAQGTVMYTILSTWVDTIFFKQGS